MKITVETADVGRHENCLILSTKRGKMSEVDIAEALATNRCCEPAYLQIIVNPNSTGEYDAALYDDGHTVVLYPMDTFAGTCLSTLAPVPPKMVDEHRHCPWCDYELADDMRYCPYCGQRIKGEK